MQTTISNDFCPQSLFLYGTECEDGSTLFVCRVENTLIEDYLADESISVDERLRRCAPVRTTCARYYGFDGTFLGEWGNAVVR